MNDLIPNSKARNLSPPLSSLLALSYEALNIIDIDLIEESKREELSSLAIEVGYDWLDLGVDTNCFSWRYVEFLDELTIGEKFYLYRELMKFK